MKRKWVKKIKRSNGEHNCEECVCRYCEFFNECVMTNGNCFNEDYLACEGRFICCWDGMILKEGSYESNMPYM